MIINNFTFFNIFYFLTKFRFENCYLFMIILHIFKVIYRYMFVLVSLHVFSYVIVFFIDEL